MLVDNEKSVIEAVWLELHITKNSLIVNGNTPGFYQKD